MKPLSEIIKIQQEALAAEVGRRIAADPSRLPLPIHPEAVLDRAEERHLGLGVRVLSGLLAVGAVYAFPGAAYALEEVDDGIENIVEIANNPSGGDSSSGTVIIPMPDSTSEADIRESIEEESTSEPRSQTQAEPAPETAAPKTQDPEPEQVTQTLVPEAAPLPETVPGSGPIRMTLGGPIVEAEDAPSGTELESAPALSQSVVDYQRPLPRSNVPEEEEMPITPAVPSTPMGSPAIPSVPTSGTRPGANTSVVEPDPENSRRSDSELPLEPKIGPEPIGGTSSGSEVFYATDGSLVVPPVNPVPIAGNFNVAQPASEVYHPLSSGEILPSSTSHIFPLPIGEIGSRYGMRQLSYESAPRMHHGVDISAPTGTPIFATKAGTVLRQGESGNDAGIRVTLDHGDGETSVYVHMSREIVDDGQAVAQGEVIGYVGETGNAQGPHLHYAQYINGVSIDPAPAIEGAPRIQEGQSVPAQPQGYEQVSANTEAQYREFLNQIVYMKPDYGSVMNSESLLERSKFYRQHGEWLMANVHVTAEGYQLFKGAINRDHIGIFDHEAPNGGNSTINVFGTVTHWTGGSSTNDPVALARSLLAREGNCCSVQFGNTSDGMVFQYTRMPNTLTAHALYANSQYIGNEIAGYDMLDWNPRQMTSHIYWLMLMTEQFGLPLDRNPAAHQGNPLDQYGDYILNSPDSLGRHWSHRETDIFEAHRGEKTDPPTFFMDMLHFKLLELNHLVQNGVASGGVNPIPYNQPQFGEPARPELLTDRIRAGILDGAGVIFNNEVVQRVVSTVSGIEPLSDAAGSLRDLPGQVLGYDQRNAVLTLPGGQDLEMPPGTNVKINPDGSLNIIGGQSAPPAALPPSYAPAQPAPEALPQPASYNYEAIQTIRGVDADLIRRSVRHLVERHNMPIEGATMLTANFMAESRLDTQAHNVREGARSLAQWRFDRLEGLPESDVLEDHIDFAIMEVQRDERSVEYGVYRILMDPSVTFDQIKGAIYAFERYNDWTDSDGDGIPDSELGRYDMGLQLYNWTTNNGALDIHGARHLATV